MKKIITSTIYVSLLLISTASIAEKNLSGHKEIIAEKTKTMGKGKINKSTPVKFNLSKLKARVSTRLGKIKTVKSTIKKLKTTKSAVRKTTQSSKKVAQSRRVGSLRTISKK